MVLANRNWPEGHVVRVPFRIRLIALLLGAALVATSTSVSAQSELVIHKDGTKLYHRPDCPVVQDMKGVLAMTRAQAESRGYKAHPDCDPANPKATATREKSSNAETVYLDGTKYYHRKSCSRLEGAKSVKPASLEIAGKTQWPCPTCKAPRRVKIPNP